MSIKLTEEQRAVITDDIRSIVDGVLTGKKLSKTRLREDCLMLDTLKHVQYHLANATASVSTLSQKISSAESSLQILVESICLLKTFQEKMKEAEERQVYMVGPSTKVKRVVAFVFDGNSAVLGDGATSLRLASEENEPVETDFYGQERVFLTEKAAWDWKARSMNYLVHTYPKNRDFKSYLVDAEKRYQTFLKSTTDAWPVLKRRR
jgi:hypothetical protein